MTGPRQVWYVAYGSNADPGRFAAYLAGGRPPGAARHYLGCRDRSAAMQATPLVVGHRRYFAGESAVWGGGIAFLDPRPTPAARTRCVGYRITLEQLVDVAAQENGGEAGDLVVPDVLPAAGEVQAVAGARRSYDTFLGLPAVGGTPAVTLTCATRLRPETVPGPEYLGLVVAGIARHHGEAPDAVLAELLGRSLPTGGAAVS